jgi:uncharacterized repeat protein (TIGR03803 family)
MSPSRSPIISVSVILALGILMAQVVPAQTFSVLHTFTGGSDGGNPGTVAVGGPGVLYGTASAGGMTSCPSGCGVVFKLKLTNSAWTLSPLHEFTGGADGANPDDVVVGPSGILYGMTSAGGSGFGTVFRFRPPASPCKSVLCYWDETVIHSFAGPPNDGATPELSRLIFDQAGNVYGTTDAGGITNVGTAFELSPSGGGWNITILHSFTNGTMTDGRHPLGGMIFDTQGNLYGTLNAGGTRDFGAVYELTPSNGIWTESILYYFGTGLVDSGYSPTGSLLMDGSGNLYGTNTAAGQNGGGTVFELTPDSGQWVLSVLSNDFTEPPGPTSGVVMDASGNLYGVSKYDGAFNLGMVYKLAHSGDGWTMTDLHDFTGGGDGAYPTDAVVLDSSGNLYGTTYSGGTTTGCSGNSGCGVVWEIIP